MKFTALIAQAPAADPAKQQPEVPFLMRPEVMIGLMALFFIVVVLPGSRRRKKEAAALLANIRPGMKVALASGILGTIVKMKDGEDEVVIKSEDSKFRVLKSTITRVLGEDAEVKA